MADIDSDWLEMNRAAGEIAEQILLASFARAHEYGPKYQLSDELIQLAVANAHLQVAGTMIAEIFDLDDAELGKAFNQAIKDLARGKS